jgi:hypothetical protein
MNVLTSAQLAAHDIASGVRPAARTQQAPRRLDIADLAELRTKAVRAAEQPDPTAVASKAAPDAPPASAQDAANGAERKPVRPGTFLDIRV